MSQFKVSVTTSDGWHTKLEVKAVSLAQAIFAGRALAAHFSTLTHAQAIKAMSDSEFLGELESAGVAA